MRANIVRIGNSRGLRIPKALLESCGIQNAVEISIVEGRLVLEPIQQAREGWLDAARMMSERGEDLLLDPTTATAFDEAEWEW